MTIQEYGSAFEKARQKHSDRIESLQESLRRLFRNTKCSSLLFTTDRLSTYYEFENTFRSYVKELGKEEIFNQLIEALKQEQEKSLESEKIALSRIEEVFNAEKFLNRNKSIRSKINSIEAAKEAISKMSLTNTYSIKSSIIEAYTNGSKS